MKIKTSELTGPALDWAVAKADGRLDRWIDLGNGTSVVDVELYLRRLFVRPDRIDYSPSTDWSQGGPIIEREFIAVHGNPAWTAQYSVAQRAHHGGFRGYFRHVGPTPLVAAMRCFVASKLGDEVEIPEELMP